MLNWLRRRFGFDTLRSYAGNSYVLSLSHIESEIRGLIALEDLRRQHRNWKGAAICRDRIKQLEEYKYHLDLYGSKVLVVVKEGKS